MTATRKNVPGEPGVSEDGSDREERQAGESPALDAPLRALKRLVRFHLDASSLPSHAHGIARRVPRWRR